MAKKILTFYQGNEKFQIYNNNSGPFCGGAYLKEIDRISLSVEPAGYGIKVLCTNLNNKDFNIEIDDLYISTSSAEYHLDDNFEDYGGYETWIDSDDSNYQILWFDDECAIDGYDITFHFYYNDGSTVKDIGTLSVVY